MNYRLCQLLEQSTATVRYDAGAERFMRRDPDNDSEHICIGVHRLLRRLMYVPQHIKKQCEHCAEQKKKKKKSRCMGKNDMDHGSIVDGQIDAYTKNACQFGSHVDPCAANAISFLKKRFKLIPIASQIPIYSPTLNVATAIDLLCTDELTGTELHLVELKATRHMYDDSGCYMAHVSRRTRGPLAGLPTSHCARNQLQLWAMYHTLTTDYDIEVDSAFVLRTSPLQVCQYMLNSWIVDRSHILEETLRALTRPTAAKRRRRN